MLKLSAECALGASIPQIAFQTAEHCVMVAGQRLKFADCEKLLEPDDTMWSQGVSQHGIALVATCPRAGMFAYSERTLRPTIHVCTYPDLMPNATLEYDCLEFTALSFARSGKQLAALTGLPELKLVVWSMETGLVLATSDLKVPFDSLSFNPSGDGSLVTLAAKKLLVWRLKLVYETYLLEANEIELETNLVDEDDEPLDLAQCLWTSHAWSFGNSLYAPSQSN